MKKRLKGLVCLWLALVVLVTMMATPAMAGPYDNVLVYKGTAALIPGNMLSDSDFDIQRVPDGGDISALVTLSDGATLAGWNVWSMYCSSGVISCETIEKQATKAADWKLTGDDIYKYCCAERLSIGDTYYIFEPLYVYSAAIDVYIGAEKLNKGNYVDSGDVDNRQITLDSALNGQDKLSDRATNNLIGWKLWEVDSGYTQDFDFIEADGTLPSVGNNVKNPLLEAVYATARVAINDEPLNNHDYADWNGKTIYLDLGTALNAQSDVMSAFETPAGKLLGGWKLWTLAGSGGEVVGGTGQKSVAIDYAVTYEDVTSIGDIDWDYLLILEPQWMPKYKIDPQPVSDNPTVGVKELASDGTILEDITDYSNVSYQWYEYGENAYCVVRWEAADDEISSTANHIGAFDSDSRTWATDDPDSSIDVFFPVKAGDIVRVTPVEGTVSGEITVKECYGDNFTENDGIYTMTMEEDNDDFNLYVLVDDGQSTGYGEFSVEIIRACIGDAVTNQTANTLTSGTDGQQYVCKAVIEDDGKFVSLTSDPVTYYTPIHTHDWTGAWSSDDTYHWRECANDGCDIAETAEKGEYGTHDFTNGTCICGKSAPGPSGGGGSPVSVYKVTFETNGAEEEIDAQNIRRDKKVQKPETPVKEGYVFDGWYIDEALIEAYDFDAWVKNNFTLYAKWTQAATTGDDNNSSDVGDAKKWNPFIDVGIDDWFHDNVKYVFENEYMNGVSAREFMPSQFVTRGMIVTILHRLDGEPKAENAATFEDVAADAYYAEAVAWAQEKAIVKGVTETEFAPEEEITREQLAVILYRYASLKGYDVSVGESTNILSYEDVDEISEYAIPALQYVIGAGIIKGKTESTLNPQESATRAEVATIIQRFVEANKI